jgi:hypothetical protein
MGKTYTHTILVKAYTKGCWRGLTFKHYAISKVLPKINLKVLRKVYVPQGSHTFSNMD